MGNWVTVMRAADGQEVAVPPGFFGLLEVGEGGHTSVGHLVRVGPKHFRASGLSLKSVVAVRRDCETFGWDLVVSR